MSIFEKTAPDSPEKASTEPAGILLNKYSLLVVAVLLVIAAWFQQTVIVILLGLALSAAALSWLWSALSLKGVHCERYLTEQRVFPGEYLELKLRLVNRKLLPLPWIQVNDEVPAGFITDFAPSPGNRPGFGLIAQSTSILWYSAISWNYRLFCNKRGYYPLGPLTVTSGDIFGFYPRTSTEAKTDFLIVYPKVYPLGQLAVPSLFPLGEAKSEKRIFEDPSRTIGIRDYSPGDSLRRIHWKASARHNHLQVKVFEPTTTLRVALFLAVDTFQSGGSWDEDSLELGISTAASLANYLVDKNSQAGLWANSRLADSGQPARIGLRGGVDQMIGILEALAKVVPSISTPFLDFFQSERKVLPLGTTLVFIFARLPERLKEVFVDLKENGYRLLVFQIGEGENGEALPDIPWYNIHQPEELAEIRRGEG
jgi:uncharacterized protein (DUF58 family)